MNNSLKAFIVSSKTNLITALKIIDKNKQGFVIVVNDDEIVIGVLTDGDIRRGIISGLSLNNDVSCFYTKNAKKVVVTSDMSEVIELFKSQTIKFLPIVDESERLVNIITKKQLHSLLLQDIHAQLDYDFMSIDTTIIDHEIYQRPWGYYKTTVLNDYYQAKIISVKPGAQLSLQSHSHREEYWIIVHGSGIVQLDNSKKPVGCGSTIFIPIGCKHRVINTDNNESLIISEVQIGDYFGEDDIVRYDDIYGRK